jgi:polyketide cyclase/dehydrase/lipid transport protein
MNNGNPTTYIVSAAATIPARPECVYALIANYNDGHRRIIPKQFSDITVEQGGIGAGTVIRFQMSMLGKKQTCRAAISEPEPGRVLVETYLEPEGTVTTFRVEQGSAPADSHVTISTELPVRDGLVGLIEKTVASFLLRSIYQKELVNLARVATGPFGI